MASITKIDYAFMPASVLLETASIYIRWYLKNRRKRRKDVGSLPFLYQKLLELFKSICLLLCCYCLSWIRCSNSDSNFQCHKRADSYGIWTLARLKKILLCKGFMIWLNALRQRFTTFSWLVYPPTAGWEAGSPLSGRGTGGGGVPHAQQQNPDWQPLL